MKQSEALLYLYMAPSPVSLPEPWSLIIQLAKRKNLTEAEVTDGNNSRPMLYQEAPFS